MQLSTPSYNTKTQVCTPCYNGRRHTPSYNGARINQGKRADSKIKTGNSSRLIWRENTTIKMAMSKKQSMTEELLEAIKEKSYDTCVSNLTKTHCVNLKKFKRDRLPEGTWISTKRFVNNSNRPVADAMFSIFGEFSNQAGPEVRDTMIGWSYDNFRLLERVFKVALDQRKTTLRSWLEKMTNIHTPGDKLALYILSRMYRRHVYVYTQMFWWTTLLYTLPITEQELLSQCEIVLVYVKDGIYGELEQIRGPVTKSTQHADLIAQSEHQNTEATSTLEASNQPYAVTTATAAPNTNPDITGSTLARPVENPEKIVTTESTVSPQDKVNDLTDPNNPLASDNTQTGSVIPENDAPHDGTPPETQSTEITGRPKASLPGIDVFLNRTCTIPLVRCEFESIKKAVEIRDKLTKKDDNQNLGMKFDHSNQQPSGDTSSTMTRTSTRKRTVIDYKKFLEEYVDLPPSPPKKKCEVDLKRRPSKRRMAAEKYRKPDFVTKPLRVPKPARRKASVPPNATPSTSTNADKDESLTQGTITKPATTQETQDAIDALLLLGTIGMPPALPENPDDNEILMPIGGNPMGNDETNATTNIPTTTTTIVSTDPPKVVPEMGVSDKSNTGVEPSDAQEPENTQLDNDDLNEDNKAKSNGDNDDQNKNSKNNKKKTFVTRQFGLKRRNRPRRKFKCEICAQELDTVHDYNQHYLYNHPLTPCPYCPCLFTSPRKMAKHRYITMLKLCTSVKLADKVSHFVVSISLTIECT